MKQIYVIAFFCVTFLGFGQIQHNAPWNKNNIQKRGEKETLEKVSKRAEEYFKTVDRNKKGSGFKPFKRWENHWSHYLKPDGSFKTFNDLKNSWLEKKELRSRSNNNTSEWKPLGPYSNSNTYSSNSFKQSGQGRINAIIVDPNNSNTFYIGAPAGGIWKSTDAGLNWTPLTDFLPHIGVSGIAINPDNSNIIYIATGDDDANDSFTAGVWKSEDGGVTWNTTGSLQANPTKMNEIYFNPNNTQTLLLATNRGVQKTTDGGATWVNTLPANIDDLKMKPGDSMTWYATSDDTFYKSTDGGESFTAISIPELTNSGRITMDVTPANPNYVYFVSAATRASNYAFNGVYKSTNSGSTFSKTTETSDIFGSTQAWFDLALTVSDTNENMIFVGVLDLWRSLDGGDSFTKINNWFNPNEPSYTHADIHFLRYFNGKFFAGTDGGIYLSTNNGDLFTDLTKNLAISQFYRLSVSQKKLNVIAGGLQDNGGFGFNGNDWKNYHGGDGMEGIVDVNNPNKFYGFTQFGGSLSITENQGNSTTFGGRTSIDAPSDETGPNDDGGEWITPMAMNKEGELFAGYSHLYQLVNNNWQKISNSFGSDITHMEIDPNNSNIIYVTTGNSLFRSQDKGQSFSNIFTFSRETITSIEISNGDSSTGWVTTNNKVYKTTALSGFFITFTDITNNLPSENKLIIKHHERSGNNTVYLGTNLGVYFINDNLMEWQSFDNNLPNTQITDLDINEEDSKLYAATYGRGIFSTDIPRQLPDNDVRLISINNLDNLISCGDQVTPEITILNQGNQTINNVIINYNLDGGTNNTFNWNGSLASNESTSIELPQITSNKGEHELNVEVNITNDTFDNNSLSSSFTINVSNDTPTTINTFENTNNELLTETTNADIWSIITSNKTLLNIPDGNKAYSTGAGNYADRSIGYLYTSCYNLSQITNPVLKFDMGFDIEADYDYLVVEYSNDRGQSWSILGNSTDPNWYNSNTTDNGLPGKQWTGVGESTNPVDGLTNATIKEYSHDLSALASETNIIFRFKFFSDQNTNEEGVIIDNLVIGGVLSINDETTALTGITLYPNPSENIFNISRNTNEDLDIKVFDLSGKEVFTRKNDKNLNISIDLGNYAKGIYILNMSSEGKTSTQKLILK
ncbi:T9SS type A sorting domain-containing protein [uncultured Tenacibaculum sp.]|uniref:T9SS type A sorting domain-containing protein n=1 Tax=uncultured Tenacibaculum sp. TaxID=174713 RepID=UPI002624040F|nr:T9SS type A sorting domain-containing protein [uncultured Tenacibaculum sp.]